MDKCFVHLIRVDADDLLYHPLPPGELLHEAGVVLVHPVQLQMHEAVGVH